MYCARAVTYKSFVMADKGGRVSGVGVKPVPMKLFATWEVEKSSPNCIPRLCSLTLTKLVILKPLEAEMQSVILAVKMQNSKRVLRSNEILISPGGLLETELDLSFSLQYPHFLKRDGNKLQVMLQRRKKYKNRTMLGYKTLAMGQVNMAQVLQRSVDKDLNLYSDLKDRADLVAKVVMLSLMSQPVDHDDRPAKKRSVADRSPDGEMSDDDEVPDDPDYSSNEELSDSDPIAGEEEGGARVKRFMKGPFRPTMGRQQRNIKQKFIALLRRLKLTDEVLDSEQDQDDQGCDQNPQDIEDLFDELENLSESDPEIDTISVLSTPKPKLRPFFSNRGSTDLLDQPDHRNTSPPTAKVKPSVTTESAKNSDEGSSSKKHESDTNLDWSDSDSTSRDIQTNIVASEPPTPVHTLHTKPLTSSQPPTPIHSLVSTPHFNRSNSQPPTPSHAVAIQSHSHHIAHAHKSANQHHHSCSPQNSPPRTPPVKPHTPKTNRATALLKDWRGSKHGRPLSKQNSLEQIEEPRKILLEQLSHVMPSEDKLPDSLILINTQDWQGQLLWQSLEGGEYCVISTCSAADVRAVIACVVGRIQKLKHRGNYTLSERCNSNSRAPAPIKMAAMGSDSYINSVLVPYVDQFSTKSPDWQHYIKFLVIPLGCSSIGKFLSQNDSKYSSLFNDTVWRDAFEKSENSNSSRTDMGEISNRIGHYMNLADSLLQIPIAEAMLTYHKEHRGLEEESSQVFVPFLSEARVGPPDLLNAISNSLDIEESTPNSGNVYVSGSPPQQTTVTALLGNQPPLPQSVEKVRVDNQTPPNSPSVATTPSSTPGHSTVTSPASLPAPFPECLELQIDYWTTAKQDTTDKSERLVKKDSKSSLKSPFRSLLVHRFPQVGQSRDTTGLYMVMVTKEKKQKIMKFGKKSKETESRSQAIEGMQRLICTSKSQNQPITVTIDGTEWTGVKFFQISSQWQTHIKSFPVLLFADERYSSEPQL